MPSIAESDSQATPWGKAVSGKFIIDPSFTVHIHRIVNSVNENDEDIDEVILKNQDNFVQDEDDASEDEDGLQHLHDCPKLELH